MAAPLRSPRRWPAAARPPASPGPPLGLCLGRHPELGQGARAGGLHGPRGDAEVAGDDRLGQVEQVAQHDHRALPGGQGRQRAGHPLAERDLVGDVGAGRMVGQLAGRVLLELPPPAVGHVVDQGPPDVGEGVVAAHPRPGRVGPHQRRLDRVLGRVPVAGQQVGGVPQAGRAGRGELDELLVTACQGRPFLSGVRGSFPREIRSRSCLYGRRAQKVADRTAQLFCWPPVSSAVGLIVTRRSI